MRASLGGYRLARKLRRVGKACLAATIKERSNPDAGLEGTGPCRCETSGS
jgi:hypothetical protein